MCVSYIINYISLVYKFKKSQNSIQVTKQKSWASEMTPGVKALSIKPDNLSSIPGTRMAEGENWELHKQLSSDFGVCAMASATSHPRIINMKLK